MQLQMSSFEENCCTVGPITNPRTVTTFPNCNCTVTNGTCVMCLCGQQLDRVTTLIGWIHTAL